MDIVTLILCLIVACIAFGLFVAIVGFVMWLLTVRKAYKMLDREFDHFPEERFK
jgi:biopolymer transport protein ExbB/TolQ